MRSLKDDDESSGEFQPPRAYIKQQPPPFGRQPLGNCLGHEACGSLPQIGLRNSIDG